MAKQVQKKRKGTHQEQPNRLQIGTTPGNLGTAMLDDIEAYNCRLQKLERIGYDLMLCGDTQMLAPDLFVTMTTAVLATERMRVASFVSNPVTRHPAVFASGLNSLQILSKGRICGGIGTGDSSLLNIGLKPVKVEQFMEFFRAVRALCDGEEAEFQGKRFRFQLSVHRVPLWMAAEGPRMLDLAGRFADGVLLGNGTSEDIVRDSIRRIHDGARAAGRDTSEIELWWNTKPYFTDGPLEHAYNDAAWSLATSGHHAFKFTLEGKFVPRHLHDPIRLMMQSYRPSEHARVDKAEHNRSIVLEKGLANFLGERFLIAGDEDRILQRIRELASWGVRNFNIVAPWGDSDRNIERMAEVVAVARQDACQRTGTVQ